MQRGVFFLKPNKQTLKSWVILNLEWLLNGVGVPCKHHHFVLPCSMLWACLVSLMLSCILWFMAGYTLREPGAPFTELVVAVVMAAESCSGVCDSPWEKDLEAAQAPWQLSTWLGLKPDQLLIGRVAKWARAAKHSCQLQRERERKKERMQFLLT